MKQLKNILAAVLLIGLMFAYAIPVQAATGDELFHFSFEDEENIGLDSAGNGTVSDESTIEDLVTVDGVVGNAASFDGMTTALYINSNLTDVKDFTLTYWFCSISESADYISLLAGDDWSSENNVLHSTITPAYGIELGGSNVSWGGERAYDDCVELEEWYFAAFTVSLTEGKTVYYLNGEPVYELESTGDVGLDFSKFTIGAWRNGGAFCRYFSGEMDELVLYEGVLTADQIKAQYDAVKSAATQEPEKTQAPTPTPTQAATATATENQAIATQKPTTDVTATTKPADAQEEDGSILLIVVIVVVIVACVVGTFFILKKKK